jgi:hypothetical protein
LAVLGDMVNNGSTTPSPLKSLPRSVHTGYGSSHVDVRSIRKYGDRVLCVWGGGAGLLQAACLPRGHGRRPLLCVRAPPTTLCGVPSDPARDDAGCLGASSGDPPGQKTPSCALSLVCQKGRVCSAGPLPTEGRVWRVLGRTCLDGCFRVFQRQRSPRVQPQPPAQTLPCVSQIHFQTSAKWKAEGWGGASGSVGGSCLAAASCQQSR